MKKVIICALFFASCVSDRKVLEESKLSIEDFKGERPSGSPFSAYTWGGYTTPLRTNDRKRPLETFYYFDSVKSFWHKPLIPSAVANRLLNHEQGHFKIIIIAAKKLQLDLLKVQPTVGSKQRADSLFLAYRKTLQERHDLYDAETNHFKDSTNQVKWDKLFLSELRALRKVKVRRLYP